MNEMIVQSGMSSRILSLRAKEVLLDSDLPELYSDGGYYTGCTKDVEALRTLSASNSLCLSLSKAKS